MGVKRKYLEYQLRWKIKTFGVKPMHFLHIGKTGGTAIKNAFVDRYTQRKPWLFSNKNCTILFHGHKIKLTDVPEGEKVFFFVRNPLNRFVSGFYSRKLAATSRNGSWSDTEVEVFNKFEKPNDLALALSSDDEMLRGLAVKGLNNMGHVRHSYWRWFGSKDYFLRRLDDILFVGRQETLNHDFERLKNIVGADVVLPRDDSKTHKTPEHLDKKLDDEAKNNLLEHYKTDYDFLNTLKELEFIKEA